MIVTKQNFISIIQFRCHSYVVLVIVCARVRGNNKISELARAERWREKKKVWCPWYQSICGFSGVASHWHWVVTGWLVDISGLSFLDETEPIWLMVRLLAPPSFCSVSALGGDGRDGNFRMYSAIFVWLYYPQSPVLEKISLWG